MKAGGWKHAGTLTPGFWDPLTLAVGCHGGRHRRLPGVPSGGAGPGPGILDPGAGARGAQPCPQASHGPLRLRGRLCTPPVEQVKPGRLRCAGLFLCCRRSAILWGFPSLRAAETPKPLP